MGDIGTIKTYFLIALIFGILTLLAYAAVVLSSVGALLLMPSGGTTTYTSPSGVSSVVVHSTISGGAASAVYLVYLMGALGLVVLILNVLIVIREFKMYSAAGQHDIEALKKKNSLLWAILALIFNGVIAGIFMILAKGQIEELSENQAVQQQEPPQPSAPQVQ